MSALKTLSRLSILDILFLTLMLSLFLIYLTTIALEHQHYMRVGSYLNLYLGHWNLPLMPNLRPLVQ